MSTTRFFLVSENQLNFISSVLLKIPAEVSLPGIDIIRVIHTQFINLPEKFNTIENLSKLIDDANKEVETNEKPKKKV